MFVHGSKVWPRVLAIFTYQDKDKTWVEFCKVPFLANHFELWQYVTGQYMNITTISVYGVVPEVGEKLNK